MFDLARNPARTTKKDVGHRRGPGIFSSTGSFRTGPGFGQSEAPLGNMSTGLLYSPPLCAFWYLLLYYSSVSWVDISYYVQSQAENFCERVCVDLGYVPNQTLTLGDVTTYVLQKKYLLTYVKSGRSADEVLTYLCKIRPLRGRSTYLLAF